MPKQDTPSAPKFAGRGGVLDGLRFLAAFSILLYHYGGEAPLPLDQLHPVFLRGFLATDFFLMLSGYVLARAYGASLASGAVGPVSFLTRRMTRVWPGHLVVLSGMAAIALTASMLGIEAGHPAHFFWPQLPAQALLIQAWGDFGGDGWNLPTWSLSALFFCYALMPILWRAILRIRPAWAPFLLGLAGLLLSDAACRAWLGRPLYDLPFNMGAFRAVPLFLLGAATARLAEASPLTPKLSRFVLICSALAFVGIQVLGRYDFPSILCIALILAAAGSQPVAKPRKILEAGAQLSFAIFITHVLTATVWFGAVHKIERLDDPHSMTQWLLWSAGILLAFAAAFAFDRLIDQPLQKLLRPARSKARPALGLAPAPTSAS
ncbi:acyltransferase [soil metagenome]